MSPQNAAEEIAIDMEDDLIEIDGLAKAIILIADGMSIRDPDRGPIECIAGIIIAKVKVLQLQGARAAGQDAAT